MVGFAPDDVMVAEAERIRDTYGVRVFKVKVGRRPIALDVDGNRGWSPSEAARALHAMADLDLTMAEELCPADDVLLLPGVAALRALAPHLPLRRRVREPQHFRRREQRAAARDPLGPPALPLHDDGDHAARPTSIGHLPCVTAHQSRYVRIRA